MGLWRTRQPPSLPLWARSGPRLKQLRARLFALSGRARLVLDDQPAEVLSMFGPQDEGAPARARSIGKKASAE